MQVKDKIVNLTPNSLTQVSQPKIQTSWPKLKCRLHVLKSYEDKEEWWPHESFSDRGYSKLAQRKKNSFPTNWYLEWIEVQRPASASITIGDV